MNNVATVVRVVGEQEPEQALTEPRYFYQSHVAGITSKTLIRT
jgi:hypothetical protein